MRGNARYIVVGTPPFGGLGNSLARRYKYITIPFNLLQVALVDVLTGPQLISELANVNKEPLCPLITLVLYQLLQRLGARSKNVQRKPSKPIQVTRLAQETFRGS